MNKKKIYLSLLLLTLLFIPTVTSNAASYNYDFFKNPVYSSEGLAYKDTFYLPDMLSGSSYDITAEPLALRKDVASFSKLSDIYVDDVTRKMYILDSRDKDTTSIKINAQFTKDGVVVKEAIDIMSNSAVYIVDEEFKVEKSFDVLQPTEEVVEKLALHYGVDKDHPEAFTDKQIKSADMINKDTRRCPYFLADIDGDSNYEPVMVCYGAEGIYVQNGYIFIADKYNSRILRVNPSLGYMVDEVYLTPNDITFYQIGSTEEQNARTTFLPSKIAVDGDNRVYTIASSTYEGIIEYNPDGEFNRFIGKNLVSKRSWWTFLLTDAQYESLALNNPNQFTNLIIDERNLIYATAKPDADATVAQEMIKLINTSGKDVLKRNGYVTPDGDVNYSRYVKPAITGSSIFVAVDVNKSRIYSVIDETRCRIFTYDDEGNLLYVSGEKGTYADTLQKPVALSYFENDSNEYLLVLDQESKSMLVYETTEFGKLVNNATDLYLNNKIDEAKIEWEKVVKMNSNYELGYIGIGKSILREANVISESDPEFASIEDLDERAEAIKEAQLATYKKAMEMFELGHDKEYYSDAFKQYRNIIIKDNFSLIMTGFVLVLVAGVVLTVFKAKYKRDLARREREAVENHE